MKNKLIKISGKALFEHKIREVIKREFRRRKIGKFYVLRDVVSIVNESMTGYRYGLIDTELDA